MQTALYTSVYHTDTTWLRCMVSHCTPNASVITDYETTGLRDMVCSTSLRDNQSLTAVQGA